jgi:hypothetical protein
MLTNSPVPMPTHHKTLRPVNGVKYVYHVIRSYRQGGKSKNDCVCIYESWFINKQWLLFYNSTTNLKNNF